jgi:ATP-dependent Clp protease ATP-binding subunit ClpX
MDVSLNNSKSELVWPQDIQAVLSGLKGQESVKLELSEILARFFNQRNSLQNANVIKTGAILVGPTGVGKTFSIEILAKEIQIPFFTLNCTSLVGSGIIGPSVEHGIIGLITSVLSKDPRTKEIQEISEKLSNFSWHSLFENKGESLTSEERKKNERELQQKVKDFKISVINQAEKGILFLDEFDKLSSLKILGSPNTWGSEIQRRLLSFIHGESLSITGHLRDEATYIHGIRFDRNDFFNTENVQIFAAGAFMRIKDSSIIAKRSIKESRNILSSQIIASDIVNYGFLRELVGRLSRIIEFSEIGKSVFEDIINSEDHEEIINWKNLFLMHGLNILITEEARKRMIEEATALDMGFRGLRVVIDKYFGNAYRRIKKEEAVTSSVIEIRG